MYTRRTYKRACRLSLRRPRRFKHFYHRLDEFYDRCADYRISSISGHALDLSRFDDVRVVRIIRDPRDLIVSGYFYHLKGVEPWSRVTDPTEDDWDTVRGALSPRVGKGQSLTTYLASVSRDEGMRAELEFRRYHLESLREWPEDDPRIRVFRYEDIIGQEVETFREILTFLGFSRFEQLWGLSYAKRHAAGRRLARYDHIRDPRSGQWRDKLPQDVVDAVARDYGDVLKRYGYPER